MVRHADITQHRDRSRQAR